MNDLSHLILTMGKAGGILIENDRVETYSDSPISYSSLYINYQLDALIIIYS